MASAVTFLMRNASGDVKHSEKPGDIFPHWREGKENWLFLAAHDDDIVCGAGLLLIAALQHDVQCHALITTDGRMGYCSEEERASIVGLRKKETLRSFEIMGLPEANVRFLGFPDGNLNAYVGRREAHASDDGAIAGFTGLENAYVGAIRAVRPTRVIMPTSADLHPDHQIANMEMQISLIHACGEIWPELGPPIGELPVVYEYATYSDFPEIPNLKIGANAELLERKTQAIRAYASQRQIEAAVEYIRQAGPVEYFRQLDFRRYTPAKYAGIC